MKHLLFLMLSFFAAAAPGTEPVTVGVLAYRGEARALEHWGATAEYLSRTVPGYRFVLRPLDLDGMEAAVSRGEVEFILTNPGQYGMLAPRHALSHLATLRSAQSGSARQATGSVLLVRRNSPYIQPEDLRDRPVAAVHPRAFGGFLLLRAALAERGIEPQEAYRMQYLGFPVDTLIRRLGEGAVEAAMVPACLLEQMHAEGQVDQGRFRVLIPNRDVEGCLSSTPLYPAWSFGALAHAPEQLTAHVARALLRQDAATAARWGAPVSPAPVETLLSRLQLHPLQPGLGQQMADWLWRYRYYVLPGVVIAVLGLLHHLWIQAVVVRRSRELREAHVQLREREQQLAQAQRTSLLGEMAASLAHELNQPLAAIRHYAEGCEMRLEGQDPNHPLLPVLRRIDEQASRGAAVVEQTRQWLHRRPPETEELPVASLIEELLGLHEQELQRHGIEVRVAVSPPALTAQGQRVSLQQVLSNLLSNSVQTYAARRISGSIRISAEAKAQTVQIRLQDEAGGFSAEQLTQPFVPFRTTRAEGLGMGLLICQRLMHAQHGGIRLANTAAGAEVILTLPRGAV